MQGGNQEARRTAKKRVSQLEQVKTLALILVLVVSVSASGEDVASWYGEEHRGLPMANGKPFDPDKLTCASWFYPFGTKLLVRSGSRSVVVTVTDRGPNRRFLKTKRRRIIDLSRAAFARIGNLRHGLVPVSVKPLDGR